MKKLKFMLILLVFVFVICGWNVYATDVVVGEEYYLACNLHPDTNGKLSSVNYQLNFGLIPWGTKMRIEKLSSKKAVLIDVDTGTKYIYEFHKRTRRVTSPARHLGRIFTKDLKSLKTKYNSLSEADKKGVDEGKIYIGMTKEGVIMAACYPPEFVVRDPKTSNRWIYWYNRFGRFVVVFGPDGKVTSIEGNYR